MTILQLKVVIATADLKSVTAAAKMVNTTQPNASNCLKLLENELGFPIFLRSSAGIALTPKGTQFLSYARQMVQMNEKAMELRNAEDVYRLHFGTVNYYAAAEPFFALCSEHRESGKNDFSFCNVSIAQGLQMLKNRSLDIFTAAILPGQKVGLKRACEKSNIEIRSVCHIPTVLMVRKNHPAEEDGRCVNIVMGSDAMKDYPYIALRNMADESGSMEYNDSDFIQCSYKMFVDDTNARLRMIEATNGFGFGVLSSYRMMSQFALDCFPVPGVTAELFCLALPEGMQSRGVQDYMALLDKEMHILCNQ